MILSTIFKGHRMKQTISFRIVAGVAEGYFHNLNGISDNDLVNKVAKLWQEIAKDTFNESGIYVSAIAQPGSVVYHRGWGCPAGGESVVVLSGTANPEFIEDLDEFREIVIKLAKELKKELKQSTLSVEFFESDFVHLTD